MGKIFGTDGVRGVVDEKITSSFVYDLGKSIAIYLNQSIEKLEKNVLIAHDTRISFSMIEKELCRALNEFGINVMLGGVMPTPAVHYLTKEKGFDVGIMITASHNPPEFNGIKVISSDGLKLNDEQEEEITEIYENLTEYKNLSVADGKTKKNDKLVLEWATSIKNIANCSLENMKVALDLANGASYFIAPLIFKELGASVVAINESGDGSLINKDCGSTHTEVVAKVTKEEGCHIGFAFDGDADRVNVSFSDGRVMSGEELMFLCVMYLKERNLLKNNTIVTPNVTNLGIDESLKKFGISVERVGVGGKNIQAKLLASKISFGAEANGHIVWGDCNKCSDGILTAVLLTKMLKEVGSFENVLKDLKVFNQAQLNVNITESQKEKFNQGLLEPVINKFNQTLNASERIIVRASGTEPLIRIIVEGENEDKNLKIAKELETEIKKL